jgi:hypothetical protein
VYRFEKNQVRLYPTVNIARSWDPKSNTTMEITCSFYIRGPDMALAPGATVKCQNDSGIYRYDKDTNAVRLYPSPEIAIFWNGNWANPIEIDCSYFNRGPDMALTLGAAIKCSDNLFDCFRYAPPGKACWYPHYTIIESWDIAWEAQVPVLDCKAMNLTRHVGWHDDRPVRPGNGQAVTCMCGPVGVLRFVVDGGGETVR